MPRTKQVAKLIRNITKTADWNIVINKDNNVECNKEVLISLSTIIKDYLEKNPNSTSYEIEISVLPTISYTWNRFSSYLRGDSLYINSFDAPFYLEVSNKLGLEKLFQYTSEIYSDINYSCDYALKNYDTENPFLLKLELIEQNIFQLSQNNFQLTFNSVMNFLKEESEIKSQDYDIKNKLKIISNLIIKYCQTRRSREDYNLGIDLLYQINQTFNIKDELIDLLIPNFNGFIEVEYMIRMLFDKGLLTKDDMKIFINKLIPEETKDNLAYLSANLIFFFDYLITELSENQTKFVNKRIYTIIGKEIKPYSKIPCEINPSEKESIFGKDCFSLNTVDKTIGNYRLSDLMKNDWELHKKLCRDGVNEDQLATLIRNDDIDNFLKFISTKENFNVNGRIAFSIYERFSILINCTYIKYAAFYSSINIFKYLYLQNATLDNTIYNFAFASGNLEIIHLCDEKVTIEPPKRFPFFNPDGFPKPYETAIQFHQSEILQWITESKKMPPKSVTILTNESLCLNTENNSILIDSCFENGNYTSLHFILTQPFYFPDILASAIKNNLYEFANFALKWKSANKDDSKLNGKALQQACNCNRPEFAELFIDNKDMLDFQNDDTFSNSFYQACAKNSVDICSMILSHIPKFDINNAPNKLNHPLYVTCFNGFSEILKAILKYRGDDLDLNGFYGYKEVFFLLCEFI